MRLVPSLLILVLCLALSGCNLLTRRAAEPQAALPFRAETRGEGRFARDFAVTVRAGGAGLEQVRETVRFEGVAYCILRFGKSDITWARDPLSGDWAFRRLDNSRLVFAGHCDER